MLYLAHMYLVLAVTLVEATGGIKLWFERAEFSVSSLFHSHIYRASSPLPQQPDPSRLPCFWSLPLASSSYLRYQVHLLPRTSVDFPIAYRIGTPYTLFLRAPSSSKQKQWAHDRVCLHLGS